MKAKSYYINAIILLLFFSIQAASQIKYQYCFCPKNDITNGSITCRVTNFDPQNINAIEILVSRSDGSNLGTSNIRLSAGNPLPAGRMISCDPAIGKTSATIKYTKGIFNSHEKSQLLYVNVINSNNTIQYSGPITITRESTAVTSFQNECENNCLKKKSSVDHRDTSIYEFSNWFFQSPKIMTIQKGSIQKDQLPFKLSELRIVPNPSMLKLVFSLNKGLSEKDYIQEGTPIRLPEFPVVSKEKVTQFSQQYSKDIAVDEKESILSYEKIKLFFNLVTRLQKVQNYDALNKELGEGAEALKIAWKRQLMINFMSFQVNTINSELDDYNNSLLDILSTGKIGKEDIYDARLFKEDIVSLINPLLGKYEIKRKPHKPVNLDYTPKNVNGPSNPDENTETDMETIETFDNVEPQLPIYFYVFDENGLAATELYSVYCVPQYQYNKFMRTHDLSSIDKFKALGKASTAFMTLETSFPRHFFAVSESGKISQEQFFEVYKIPRDPADPKMTKPYSFPIYLSSQQ